MASSISRLTTREEDEFNTAWKKFFYDVESVVETLKFGTAVDIQNVLEAGERWTGAGWTTTRAATELRRLTGVALVTPEFEEYRGAFCGVGCSKFLILCTFTLVDCL